VVNPPGLAQDGVGLIDGVIDIVGVIDIDGVGDGVTDMVGVGVTAPGAMIYNVFGFFVPIASYSPWVNVAILVTFAVLAQVSLIFVGKSVDGLTFTRPLSF
jgi:hypothetical protein